MTGALGTNYSSDTNFALPFDTELDISNFTDGVSLGTRAIALDSNNIFTWNGNDWHGEVYSPKQNAFSISATSAQNTLGSVPIPAGSLGLRGFVLAFVHGVLTQNTGTNKDIGLTVTLAGTTVWGDLPTSSFIPSSATGRPFWWRLILQNDSSFSSQRLAGDVRIGGAAAASVAGLGRFANADVKDFTISGTSSINMSVADRIIALNATLSTASTSFSIVGDATFLLVPSHT